jgi:hypothetical protein
MQKGQAVNHNGWAGRDTKTDGKTDRQTDDGGIFYLLVKLVYLFETVPVGQREYQEESFPCKQILYDIQCTSYPSAYTVFLTVHLKSSTELST